VRNDWSAENIRIPASDQDGCTILGDSLFDNGIRLCALTASDKDHPGIEDLVEVGQSSCPVLSCDTNVT
jgi:hypothetical protein